MLAQRTQSGDNKSVLMIQILPQILKLRFFLCADVYSTLRSLRVQFSSVNEASSICHASVHLL